LIGLNCCNDKQHAITLHLFFEKLNYKKEKEEKNYNIKSYIGSLAKKQVGHDLLKIDGHQLRHVKLCLTQCGQKDLVVNILSPFNS
jgi:hypothetical protein